MTDSTARLDHSVEEPHWLRLAWTVLAGLALLVPAARAPAEACHNAPVPIAHCSGATRNFKSVLVAIHGWNGSCATTFGQGDGSLLAILEAHSFYDLDCFEYDSRQMSIADNVRKLYGHLIYLHSLGYEEAMLVTHSTGGIIALDFLPLVFLDADSGELTQPSVTAPFHTPDGIRIVGIHAWATPIEGLRRQVRLGGGIARVVGLSSETLHDLAPGSAYLSTLKGKLKALNEAYRLAAPRDQGRTRVEVHFYHGQRDDWVVLAIDWAAAEAAGWYWPDRGSFTQTDSGHSHNVAASGEIGAPKYPGRLMGLEALLSLRVKPRFAEIFPDQLTSVPKSLETRQLDVIAGLTRYAEERFPAAFSPALEFLARVFRDAFPRSSKVDNEIVSRFLTLIQRHTGNVDDDLVKFYEKFVVDVLGVYDPAAGGDLARFGGGRSDTARTLLRVMQEVAEAVRLYVSANPDRASELLPESGSLAAFNTVALTMLTGFLDSPHGPVQLAAIYELEATTSERSDEEIISSSVVPKLTVYLEENYSELSMAAKAPITRIYADWLGREGQVRSEALAGVNQKVRWYRDQRPLWTTLDANELAHVVVDSVDPSTQFSSEEFQFASDVVRHTGKLGNDVDVARSAVVLSREMILRSGDEREARIRVLEEAGMKSPLPVIQFDVQRALEGVRSEY